MEQVYLKQMQEALTLRHLIEQEHANDEPDDTERDLIRILNTFILDLKYRLGQVESPYRDDLHRLGTVKYTVRSMDGIFDRMTELSNGEPLPLAAKGLCQYLLTIALNLANVMQGIEAAHPDMTEHFAMERQRYADANG